MRRCQSMGRFRRAMVDVRMAMLAVMGFACIALLLQYGAVMWRDAMVDAAVKMAEESQYQLEELQAESMPQMNFSAADLSSVTFDNSEANSGE